MTRVAGSNEGVRQRLLGIDAFKVLSFLAVILLHTVAFDPSPGLGVLRSIAAIGGVFAVPFFFTASGFFLANSTAGALPTIWKMAKRLIPVFLFWALFYFLLAREPIANLARPYYIKELLINGGPGFHLWFLPSLGVSAAILLLLNARLPASAVLIVALAVYLIGLQYNEAKNVLSLPDINWNFRDGPFIGLLFVAIGFYANRLNIRLAAGSCWLLIVAGLAMQITESALLSTYGIRDFGTDCDNYLGTILYASGIFGLALGADNNQPIVRRLAPLGLYALGFYCLHIAVMWGLVAILPDGTAPQLLVIAVLIAIITIPAVMLLSRVPVLNYVVK